MANDRKSKERRNASPAQSFAAINSERHRLPASEVELTAEERKLLKDPDWIDEDEADVIISIRRESQEGHLARPFREYLKQRGIKVEG